MSPWLSILTGLVTLVVGAEILVRGAAWIAQAMGIRPLVVGLTVVAIGTSAPELVVSLIAAYEGEVGIVVGNVFGSNVANLALILGATTVVAPIVFRSAKIHFELYWLLFASVLTLVPFALGEEIGALVGGAFILLLICFLVWLVHRERIAHPNRLKSDRQVRDARRTLLNVAYVFAGLAGLYYGGRWLVDGATQVAEKFEIGDDVIGATIIAIGTSLPELATSVVAARRGHPELGLGNIIGSNIFNILLVLGATGLVTPIPYSWDGTGMRVCIAMLCAILVAIFLLGPGRIGRRVGGALLLGYVGYLTLEVMSL